MDLYKQHKNYQAKIENNKIYYLAHIHNGDCLGNLEERVYTIKNDKLIYEVLNTYKVLNGAGVCE